MLRPTRLDYCQYLLSTSINYTLTHFADHTQRFSHDQINRYLAGDRLRPSAVWEHVKSHLEQTPDGYIIFEDTVLNKRYAKEIALAKRQYSGNARRTINGIGIVTCVYVNPALDRYWLIDYRIYDKPGDGKSKLDHVRDMLWVLVYSRNVAFSTVLMDSWYASKSLLLYIESLEKKYYVPLKSNRLVDDSNGSKPYQRIDALQWTTAEETFGKRLKLNKFPKNHKVKVFRVASSRRTDYVVTNDLSQSDVCVVRQVCDVRWKIEQLHRELKQTTGIGKCQCRQHRAQRNHIACCFWIWVSLTRTARAAGQTIYQLKGSLLDDYIRQQLQKPAISINIA